MLSLHHVTHAVCMVIICVLVKKYMELRSSHSHVQLELRQLQLACHSLESPPHASVQQQLCPCSAQSSDTHHHLHVHTDVHMSPTDTKTHFQMFSQQQQHSPPSATSSELHAETSGSTDFPVDEFGRTLDHSGDNGGTVIEIEGSTASTHIETTSVTQAAMQSSVPTVRADPQGGRSGEWAGEWVDGRTDTAPSTSVSVQGTSESLEKVEPSPSLAVSFSTMETSYSVQAGRVEADDDDNDFYQGSLIRHSDRENDVDVIVTSISGSLKTDFLPHNVDLSFQTLDDYEEDFEEWEEETAEDEEAPHPAFGKVKLQWMTDKEKEDMAERGSSAQCTGQSLSDRMCRFQHLCFQPETQQFVFFFSAHSRLDNVPPEASRGEAVLEMSTVAGHNAKLFTYLTQPASTLPRFNIATIPGVTVIFKRFKPDNIMHALHDDIFPLFHTLMSLHIKPDTESKKFPVSLFLADENSEGEFYDLYDVFAANGTFTSGSLTASVAKAGMPNSLVCFSEAQVGLAKMMTWYQYGFFSPQGPLPDVQVQSHHIHSAASYLLDRFARRCELCGEGGHLVLISRKETRRILNEMDLVLALSKEFRVKVMTVSLETHHLADILPIIHSSRGIVGMHGSLLALAAFLPQGSVVVELFPYAVPPHHYAPYATLSALPGMLLAYRAWTNQDADRSLPHPDWLAEVGGIQHLPPQQQQEIVSQTEVPQHLCCEDPSWLYHIFQDTRVHIPEVLSLVSSALQESFPLVEVGRDGGQSQSQSPDHPGPPHSLRCSVERSEGRPALVLEWGPPWEAAVGSVGVGHDYTVVLQQVGQPGGDAQVMEVEGGDTVKVKVREGVREGKDYRVWVRSRVGGVYGHFAAVVLCSTL
ncbi:protein O-linked-mannose beta-1,4-N-acetylglucosaminyltransferase 2-like [Babylonia areolata]|uniref:protein O-linked-mannose beta-1,4-N-acetylglucosaminyltransferase 2-like n=1 Tax=Babylonia areolata TaxID=304850 RepID=UPI003FD012CF